MHSVIIEPIAEEPVDLDSRKHRHLKASITSRKILRMMAQSNHEPQQPDPVSDGANDENECAHVDDVLEVPETSHISVD